MMGTYLTPIDICKGTLDSLDWLVTLETIDADIWHIVCMKDGEQLTGRGVTRDAAWREAALLAIGHQCDRGADDDDRSYSESRKW